MKRHQLKLAVSISILLVWLTGTAWAGDNLNRQQYFKNTGKNESRHHPNSSGAYRPSDRMRHPHAIRRPDDARPAPFHYNHHHHKDRHPSRPHRPYSPYHRERYVRVVPIIPVPPLLPLPPFIFHPALVIGIGK